MPLTVITLKNVPPSLRGDLSKWMQEIATGVYVGNFNVKIREKLWKRVKENVGAGEATLSYYCRNEIGYDFDSINSNREIVYDQGFPLILEPSMTSDNGLKFELGFSKQAKFRKIKRYSSVQKYKERFLIMDIETTGLNPDKDKIIEIGIIKCDDGELFKKDYLIKGNTIIPEKINKLTGISDELIRLEGRDIEEVLKEVVTFIGEYIIVGYNVEFDIKFLNKALKECGNKIIKNKRVDLANCVKREKLFLDNYKLQTVLKEYGINKIVPHRALEDCELILELSTKVNKFKDLLK